MLPTATFTPAHYQAFILWIVDGEKPFPSTIARNVHLDDSSGELELYRTHFQHSRVWIDFRPDIAVLSLALTCKQGYALFDAWRPLLYAAAGRAVLIVSPGCLLGQHFTFAHCTITRDYYYSEEGWPGKVKVYTQKTPGSGGRAFPCPPPLLPPRGAIVRFDTAKAMMGDEAWEVVEAEEPTPLPTTTLTPT